MGTRIGCSSWRRADLFLSRLLGETVGETVRVVVDWIVSFLSCVLRLSMSVGSFVWGGCGVVTQKNPRYLGGLFRETSHDYFPDLFGPPHFLHITSFLHVMSDP